MNKTLSKIILYGGLVGALATGIWALSIPFRNAKYLNSQAVYQEYENQRIHLGEVSYQIRNPNIEYLIQHPEERQELLKQYLNLFSQRDSLQSIVDSLENSSELKEIDKVSDSYGTWFVPLIFVAVGSVSLAKAGSSRLKKQKKHN